MTESNSKTALVTGAGKRLGRAIALALGSQGWDIGVHYRDSAQEAEDTVQALRALGRKAVALRCDLADENAAAALPGRCAEELEAPSCLVNNASLFSFDDVQSFSTASLWQHMQVNLAAPLLLTQAMASQLPQGSQGVVINLLDQKLANLNPDFLSYTLSKAALQTATTMLAQALAPRLRVVGVAPGITMVSGQQSEEEFRRAHAMTPLGRSSSPEDIAAAVCFAANSPAITGTTIYVDGGQHLLGLPRDVMFIAK